MKRFIALVLVCSLLYACEESDPAGPLKGIWVAAFTQQANQKPMASWSRNLLEFGDTSAFVTAIGDISTDELGLIATQEMPYELTDSIINFAGDNYHIVITEDSLLLRPVGAETSLVVFRKLNSQINEDLKVKKNSFQGLFSYHEKELKQKVDFVNDSIVLIHNNSQGLRPFGEKWNIVQYKGLNFLNIHNDLFGLSIIQSMTEDSIVLSKPYLSNQVSYLIAQKTERTLKAKSLIGTWVEADAKQSALEKRSLLHLAFTEDSMTSRMDTLTNTKHWGLSSDGKRLFFSDLLREDFGAWDIIDYKNNALMLRVRGLGTAENLNPVLELVKDED